MEIRVTRNLFWIFLALDVLIIILSLVMQGYWLLNTQIAFICSLFVSMATFFSYKRVVERRVEAEAIDMHDDSLKKHEDPFELYEEEKIPEQTEVEVSKKSGVKESVRNLARSYKGALSPFRLGAYFILFISVLALIRHELFSPIAFLVGLNI